MDIEIRTIEPHELPDYEVALEGAFSGVMRPDELQADWKVTELDRSLVAIDDGVFVGGAKAVSFTLTVPGGAQVSAAGVTGVGVRPTHRRRGINTALMRRQLEGFHERGDPLAVLGASEAGIYGRFGYGLAAFSGAFDIEVERSAFVPAFRPTGRVRLLDRAAALEAIRPVYRAVQPTRPGMIELEGDWWEWRFFEGERDKEEPYFWAVHDTDGIVDAYAVYKVKHEWPDSIPRLELTVVDLLGTTPQSEADMWRFVFDIDLVHRAKASNRPADEPLLRLLQEPRRLRFMLKDDLWLRLVDVAAALEVRGYAEAGRVAIEVLDDFCPWNQGPYLLEAEPAGGSFTSTDAEPELVCTAADLGDVYLGGGTFRQLHRAGRIQEITPGALARADALFASDPAPWCSFHF